MGLLCNILAVDCLHLLDDFVSQSWMKQQQDTLYLLSFLAAIASASCVLALAQIGHKYGPTWSSKEIGNELSYLVS